MANNFLPSITTMTGDSGSGGTAGLVPAPAAGDTAAGKVLGAGGTFIATATVKQSVIGTARLTDTTVSSASYASFGATISVVFTAANTATYRIYTLATVFNGSDSSIGLHITTAIGSPTLLYAADAVFDTVSTTNIRQTASPFALFGLTAGATYGFVLQGKASAGTVTLNASSLTGGVALVADQVSG